MSGVINIFLVSTAGQQHIVQFKPDYTLEDLKKTVGDTFGRQTFRLIANGREITDDPRRFTELKKSIRNNSRIYVLQRMDSGSGATPDIESHKAIIRADLQDELRKIPITQNNVKCTICLEEKYCIKVCCGSIICKECFPLYFNANDYKLVCISCKQTLPPEKLFVTRPFIQSLIELDGKKTMTRYIDCQICKCGAVLKNASMYAKQQCKNCQRWLCFFCNADWDDRVKRMQNVRYSCRVNCFWETKLTYELVPLEYNKTMKVPNRRCCPKCFECGAYGLQCKYHTCRCGHNFCFICLKTEEECRRCYKSNYDGPCSDVVQQSYDIFPRRYCDEPSSYACTIS